MVYTPDHNTAPVDYEKLAVDWHDSQKFGPAPRHRRRLMLSLIKALNIQTVLEVGCGQPYFANEILRTKLGVRYTGTDISKALIQQNRREFPRYQFEALDIVGGHLSRKYDIVIATEMLEHVTDYRKALGHMAVMASKYILITVPSCQVFPIDKAIGHYRHYKPQDVAEPLRQLGFRTIQCYRWGFPFFNLYKHAINAAGSPEKMRATFGDSQYSWMTKAISQIIYLLFFLNIKRWGYQLVLLAERDNFNT